MPRLLLLFLIILTSSVAYSQERKLDIYTFGSDTPVRSWHVNPASVVKVDAATGVLVYESAGWGKVEDPVIWLTEIDHMQFAYDPDGIGLLEADDTAGWRIASPAGDYLSILPPADTDLCENPLPISIFDTAGRIVGGFDRWDGRPVKVSMLPKGNYLIRIGSSVTLKFIKS